MPNPQRYIPGVKKPDGYLQPYMSPNPQGGYVSFEDYEAVESQRRELEEALKGSARVGDGTRDLALHRTRRRSLASMRCWPGEDRTMPEQEKRLHVHVCSRCGEQINWSIQQDVPHHCGGFFRKDFRRVEVVPASSLDERQREVDALAATVSGAAMELANGAPRDRIIAALGEPHDIIAAWVVRDDEECQHVADIEDALDELREGLKGEIDRLEDEADGSEKLRDAARRHGDVLGAALHDAGMQVCSMIARRLKQLLPEEREEGSGG